MSKISKPKNSRLEELINYKLVVAAIVPNSTAIQ